MLLTGILAIIVTAVRQSLRSTTAIWVQIQQNSQMIYTLTHNDCCRLASNIAPFAFSF
jgi:hypothetical protein